jgi:NTP pyrophosphatase (non-canonical NTP hydrolase)
MTDTHYNRLSAAELERLAMLTEEAGEVVLGVSDLLRAYERLKDHPEELATLEEKLEGECADFFAVCQMMEDDLVDCKKDARHLADFLKEDRTDLKLIYLSGMAGRIVQIACKILRHGYDSYHPFEPETNNRKLLSIEISRFTDLCQYMPDDVFRGSAPSAQKIIDKKLRYSHHQDHQDRPNVADIFNGPSM